MQEPAFPFASRFDGITGSAIREIFKMIAKPGMISFAGGNPASSALPDEAVAAAAQKVLQKNGKAILQYGATEGYPPFLESLESYVKPLIGSAPHQVLPVTGSSQAMDLLCKALINPGDAVLVENPSFLGNLQCLRLYQARLLPVDSDDQGLLPHRLEEAIRLHRPKMLYTIPTFQNPTGRTMSLGRRQAVAKLAAEYGVVVAEDDPYRDLRYQGEQLPTIKSFDQSGHVVLMGSFSKTISPGLRVGYMAGHPDLLRKCAIGKQSADVHTSNLNQAIVDELLRTKFLDDHLPAVCKGYAQQLQTMLEAMASFPAGTQWTRPEGGLFLWVTLPEGYDAVKLLPAAVERHVAYVPGTHFYVDGQHPATLRLNFSNSTVEQIRQGMDILRQVLEESR